MTLNDLLAQNPEPFYTFANKLFWRTMPDHVRIKLPAVPKRELVWASADIVGCLLTISSAEEKGISVLQDMAEDVQDGILSGRTVVLRLAVFDLMREAGRMLDGDNPNRLSDGGHQIAIETFLEIGNLVKPFDKTISDDFLRLHECLVNLPRATNNPTKA